MEAIGLGLGDEVGTLEEGKMADLIVVDGDPLAEISVLRDRTRIEQVFRSGKTVPRLGD